MKSRQLAFVMVTILCTAASTLALDRDARMIDQLGVRFGAFGDGDLWQAAIKGETALLTHKRDWAILVAGGYGSVSPDDADDVDFWEAGVGIKHYLSVFTSLSVMGRYRSYDLVDDPDAREISAWLTQRLSAPEEAISPYMTGAFTYRSSEWDLNPVENVEDFTEIEGAFGVGCDFLLTETLAMTLDARYALPVEISGDNETPDIWTVGVFFKGFWGE